jgi:hypothetical protein
MAKKKVQRPQVVSYRPGSRARAAIVELLNNTGRNRNGSASDYKFVLSCARFGKETGFVTVGQLRILGCMYNRVMNDGKRFNWKNLVD